MKRLISILAIALAVVLVGGWGSAWAGSSKPVLAPKIIYRVPNMGDAERSKAPAVLFKPVYAFGGKAVVYEAPRGRINVITDGKTTSFSLPASAVGFRVYAQTVIVGSRLPYFRTKPNLAIGSIDILTGKTGPLATTEPTPFNGFVSPDGKHAAYDGGDNMEMLDMTTGKRTALPAFSRNDRVLAWNATSDGLYLLRSDRTKTELLLWRLSEEKPTSITTLAGDVDWEVASLSLETNKLVWIDRRQTIMADRNQIHITDLTTGKTGPAIKFEGHCENPLLSPTGRYLLVDCGPGNDSWAAGQRIYDLATGKSATYLVPLLQPVAFPTVSLFTWHPTQDKLLVGYAYSETKLELREYDVEALMDWMTKHSFRSPKTTKR